MALLLKYKRVMGELDISRSSLEHLVAHGELDRVLLPITGTKRKTKRITADSFNRYLKRNGILPDSSTQPAAETSAPARRPARTVQMPGKQRRPAAVPKPNRPSKIMTFR